MTKHTSDQIDLQADVFWVLTNAACPAMTAVEVRATFHPDRVMDGKLLSVQMVVGALSSLKHAKQQVRYRRLVVRDLTMKRVPGRFVGKWKEGLVDMPECKNHWFLHARLGEVMDLNKSRNQEFREKYNIKEPQHAHV